jgi:DNA modification methylase
MKKILVEEIPLNPGLNATYSIKSNNITAYTHGFFKYPCKFIPHVPRWAIRRYLGNNKDGLLDPFCGSGTSLVEGVIHKKTSYGIDIDPFGRLLAEVKTTPFTTKEIAELPKIIETIRNRLGRQDGPLFIPNIPNIEKWFTKKAINDLARLKAHIDHATEENKKSRKFFYIVLASIIRKVSNADAQSPKPYVSTRFKRDGMNAVETFFGQYEKFIERIREFSSLDSLGKAHIVGNDARNIDRLIKGKVKLAVTSPPYINAFDYVRSLKLENLWLGLSEYDDLVELRPKYVGTENISIDSKEIPQSEHLNLQKILKAIHKADNKRAWVVQKFFQDMATNISQVYETLQKDGCYTIVIGESRIRGVRIPTHKILSDIAIQKGFKLDTTFSYEIKNRYLRFPRQGRGGFIKKDWVVSLVKA